MAWQTPIFHGNLKSFVSFDVDQLNEGLSSLILHAYQQIEKGDKNLKRSSGGPDTINQAFYDWQIEARGFEQMVNSREGKNLFGHLIPLLHALADSFFSLVGISPEEIEKRSRGLRGWATVHEGGSFHLPHSHPSHSLSGVYYVRTPPDSGEVIFEDGRGPLPPFDNRIRISPVAGDIILFPSWLLHSVMPTIGDETRISIAFNFDGEWEMTSNIQASMDVAF